MPQMTDRRTEQLVLMHYKPGMFFKHLQRVLRSKNIYASDKTCKDIVEGRGKQREAEMKGEKYKRYQPPRKVSPKVLRIINQEASAENPLSQRSIGIKAKVS